MKPSLTESAAAYAALAVKLRMAAVTRPHVERRASVLFIRVSIGSRYMLDMLEGRLVLAIRQGRKYPLGTNEVKTYSTDVAALLDVVIIRCSCFMGHCGVCERCSL